MESTSNSPTPDESEPSFSASTPVPSQPDAAPDQLAGSVTTPSVTPSEPVVIQPITSSSAPATSQTTPAAPGDTTTTFPPQIPTAATATEAVPTAPQVLSSATDAVPKRARVRSKLLLIGLGLGVLIAGCVSSYLLGKHTAQPAAMNTSTQQTAMTVPKDATVIEQCAPGFGTQYVLPKDIPGGPVYNVYQGKLIGIEYMTALTSASNPDLMLKDLPLYAQKYDHVDIMTMPAHAGFPKPHYQVDVMMVPTAVSSKITCGNSSADMSHSSMGTSTNTTNSSMSNMSM